MQAKFTVNQTAVELDVDPECSLLSLLRDELSLTGTKYGCGDGKCGACTVHLDGDPVQACTVFAKDVIDHDVTTVEGVAQDGKLHVVQQAIVDANALQCGYCTPGMVMSAVALLNTNPRPTRRQIVEAMNDNICRCGVYQRLLDAVVAAIDGFQDPTGATEASAMLPGQDLFADVTRVDEQKKGIVVAFVCDDLEHSLEESGLARPPLSHRLPNQLGPWVRIDDKGAITVYAGKAEVGQSVRVSLAQIVAEELRQPIDSVRVVLADTDRVPYDRGTFGSRTTPVTGRQLFKVSAKARRVLLQLAASHWGVPTTYLRMGESMIIDTRNERTVSFGKLAMDRQLQVLVHDDDAEGHNGQGSAETPAVEWTTAGQSVAKRSIVSFVTGQHRYASDVTLPDMLYAKILRPPAFHATLADLDVSAAESMPGVTVVRGDDDNSNFVGVTAPDELTTVRALDAIRARWRTELQLSQNELFDHLKTQPDESPTAREPFLASSGSVQSALAAADQTLSQSYTVDYIAHTPMEPRVALAAWEHDHLTVWTGSQRPFGVRVQLAEQFKMPVDQVRVIVPDTGAGFGGKHSGDAAIEAAYLARRVGKPVKLAWTREEEFTWAVFRPAGLIEVSTGATMDGDISALAFHNYNSGAAGIENVYEIANQHIEFHPADSPLREGAYRALSTTANTFARETHLDELADLLNLDPLALRLKNLADDRQIAVLQAAADTFGWSTRTLATNHGIGLACGYDKGSYVAVCAEVRVAPESGQLTLIRVVEAFECGAILNPDNLRSQMEGAIVQGLGGALFESIQFANGRILNPNFSDYRVPRFADSPTIETVLVNRPDLRPAGAGETPIVAIAPAVGNAIFDACGIRLRAMPMAPLGIVRSP